MTAIKTKCQLSHTLLKDWELTGKSPELVVEKQLGDYKNNLKQGGCYILKSADLSVVFHERYVT